MSPYYKFIKGALNFKYLDWLFGLSLMLSALTVLPLRRR